MDTDGVQTGFDCALTRAVSRATRIPVIASGGAGEPDHFTRVLTEGEADAAPGHRVEPIDRPADRHDNGRRLQPRRTVLTHMGPDIDFAGLSARLPDGIEPAYDGMVLQVAAG